MDETALRLDAPSAYSYAERGSQRVVADTTGHEAVRISIALCASASGTKLPILVIIPRATPLPGFVPPDNVIVLYRTASTFNGEILRDHFLKRVLFPYIDRSGFQSSRLLWDSAPCHLRDVVKECAQSKQLTIKNIPARLTGVLQPADVCWIKPIKAAFRLVVV